MLKLVSSDMERVRRIFYTRFKINKAGCWIWKGRSQTYGSIYLDGKSIGAHRLSFWIHHYKPEADAIICHHCDVPLCVNPDHVYDGTKQSNSSDAKERGRMRPVRGTKHPLNKLSPSQVRFIFQNRQLGRKRIAKRFHISGTLVGNIRKSKTWTHITSGLPFTLSPYIAGAHWQHVHI